MMNGNGMMTDIDKMSNDEMEGKYLTFWTDGQLFGIPISHVVQIIKVQEITKIPEFPTYAKGIINLRGSIIPVIDMRLRFHKEEIPYNDHTCVIVTNINNSNVGFLVDNVDEVTDIENDKISPPPMVSGDFSDNFLSGIGDKNNRVILILNTEKLVSQKDFDNIVKQEI